jgi:hypothetical protein
VRDTAKPGKRTTGLEPATFGLGSRGFVAGIPVEMGKSAEPGPA